MENEEYLSVFNRKSIQVALLTSFETKFIARTKCQPCKMVYQCFYSYFNTLLVLLTYKVMLYLE